MEITIAIVSDLHCHHSSQQPAESLLITDADRSPSSQHPVEALLELIETTGIRADALLMPGDLTNRVDPQGIQSGWTFVREIASALRAKIVAPTLGNHDVISRRATQDPFHLARGLRPMFPTASSPVWDGFWARGFCFLEQDDTRILVVNSVASHTNAESAKQGLVTNQQLDDIARSLVGMTPKTFQISVCHHHPILHEDVDLGKDDVMENGSLLTALLSEHGFDLAVHGHKHHPKLTYAPGARPLPVLAAGSFAAGMKHGLATRTRNVFHLATLSKAAGDAGCANGTVVTWQFRQWKGWTPATWDSAEFPHRTGFGCHETPDELAGRVVGTLRKLAAPVCRWGDVLTDIPQLRFIPPASFEAIGRRLKANGFDLSPFPPDEPNYIGMPQ